MNGWDDKVDDRTCANQLCSRPIRGREFMLQVSTRHVRWFCGINCAIDGKRYLEDKTAGTASRG